MQYSVVNYKTVKENSDFRIDADYFRPDFLNSLELVNSRDNSVLSEISNVNGGKRLPLGENFSDEGVPYIRAEDIKNGFVQYEDSPKISLKLHDFLKRYQTKKNDVLITIVGSIGEVGLVKFNLEKCNLTENCAKVTNLKGVVPEFLFSFFLSKYGQIQIHREKVGTAQPKLALERIRKFKIPLFGSDFQGMFSKIINQAHNFIENSKFLYSQAEELLLSELDLVDWKPKIQLTFVKNFSDTQKAERIDAEYFQPKYEEIIKAVKKYKGGFVTLGEVAMTKRGSLIPDIFYNESEGIPYIRGADFSNGFLDRDKLIYISNSFISKKETKVRKNDIIFALIGTVGSSAFIEEEFDGSFISNNLGKIATKDYRPVVLQVLLHSIIGKMFFEKIQTQTAQPKISDKDIHNFILPKLEVEIERKIEIKYLESQKAKKLSKSLLEIAKRGVEMAIEKDEQEAEKWIKSELAKLEIKL
jgi:restriction endonuclease S subunit